MSLGKAKKETLVEAETEFLGSLASSCPVLVHGLVDGSVAAPSVTISETGRVTGEIRTVRLWSEGSLGGTIDADEVSLAGKVHGQTTIRAQLLEVRVSGDGAKLEVTFGACDLAVGEEPSARLQAAPSYFESSGDEVDDDALVDDADLEHESPPLTGADAELEPDASSEAVLEPDTSSDAELEPDASSEAELEPDTSSEAELEPEASSGTELHPQPKVTPEDAENDNGLETTAELTRSAEGAQVQ